MDQINSFNFDDIPAPGRATIENLLGRSIDRAQKVFIMTFTPGAAVDPQERATARARLEQTLASQAKQASESDVSAAEADDAVAEAMTQIRRRRS